MFILHVCLSTGDMWLFSVHSLTFREPTFLPCSVFFRPAELQYSSSGHKSYECRFVLLYIIHRALGESAESKIKINKEKVNNIKICVLGQHLKDIFLSWFKLSWSFLQSAKLNYEFLCLNTGETSGALPRAWSLAYWVAVCTWWPSKDPLLCLMGVFIVISLADGT